MTQTELLFRLAQKLQDETFDPDRLDQYNLYLTVGPKTVRIAVADTVRNKFLALLNYETEATLSWPEWAEQLDLIYEQHKNLSQPHWKSVRIALKNQDFTLIPPTLFDEKEAATYLRLHTALDEQEETVFYYRHPNLELVNIFGATTLVVDFLHAKYPHRPVRLIHQTSALIEGMLHQHERSSAKKAGLFVEQHSLTVVVVRDGGLEFCNIFHYTTPEDFIYFAIFVMQEQKLNPDVDPVTVWGDLTHASELFNMLRKYIRHVKLGKKLSDIAFSYKFDELFDHRFFDVYSIHLCE
ncbi:DUF3822 family protein [soil metagenome]